jgi:hypothetical protein
MSTSEISANQALAGDIFTDMVLDQAIKDKTEIV